MIGRASRNENRAASGRSNRRSLPVAIVKPEREKPAISPAAACAIPIQKPSSIRMSPRLRSRPRRRAATPSAKKNQAHAKSIDAPIRPIDRSPSNRLRRKSPASTPGIVPTIRGRMSARAVRSFARLAAHPGRGLLDHRGQLPSRRDDQRRDGPQMQHDVERQGDGVVRNPHQGLGEEQVGGGRNRNELGQTLHGPEDQRLDERHRESLTGAAATADVGYVLAPR